MISTHQDSSDNNVLLPDERRTLEVEYSIAFETFKMENSQTWQTFQIVTTLSLAGLAFVGQLKSNYKITWPMSTVIGIAMIIILVGWLALARRWWAYAAHVLYRMREIEKQLNMYLFTESNWLRTPLSDDTIKKLNFQRRTHYETLYKVFPKFPTYQWNQQVISTIIIFALIIIWVLFITADIFSLI